MLQITQWVIRLFFPEKFNQIKWFQFGKLRFEKKISSKNLELFFLTYITCMVFFYREIVDPDL